MLPQVPIGTTNDPPLAEPEHDLPTAIETPRFPDGRVMHPGRNWWAITPGYRHLVKLHLPASRRFVTRKVRRIDSDVAEVLAVMQSEIESLKRQLRQNRGRE
jgi:hypothetical protein